MTKVTVEAAEDIPVGLGIVVFNEDSTVRPPHQGEVTLTYRRCRSRNGSFQAVAKGEKLVLLIDPIWIGGVDWGTDTTPNYTSGFYADLDQG